MSRWWWHGAAAAHWLYFSVWSGALVGGLEGVGWGGGVVEGRGARKAKNKADPLPLHIHVSRRRFMASWHNVRTINVSYTAALWRYGDSLTCSARPGTACARLLQTSAFWVCGCPLWRDRSLCCEHPEPKNERGTLFWDHTVKQYMKKKNKCLETNRLKFQSITLKGL